MRIEQKNKKEVLELIEKHERVLAYEKIMGEEKEIRLLVIDDKLTGIIFSPNIMHFDLSKFDGIFNIRTDLYDDYKFETMKIDLKLDSIKIYNHKLSAFLLPDQIDILEKEIIKIVEKQINDAKENQYLQQINNIMWESLMIKGKSFGEKEGLKIMEVLEKWAEKNKIQ